MNKPVDDYCGEQKQTEENPYRLEQISSHLISYHPHPEPLKSRRSMPPHERLIAITEHVPLRNATKNAGHLD